MDNITSLCKTYSVDLRKIPEFRSEIDQKWGKLDVDCMDITMNEKDIDKFGIPSYAINYNSLEIDDIAFEVAIKDRLGNYPYYLIYGENIPWLDSKYVILSNLSKICSSKDFSLYLVKNENGALTCQESSPDRLSTNNVLIIGLTLEQFQQLESAKIDEIEQFVFKYL